MRFVPGAEGMSLLRPRLSLKLYPQKPHQKPENLRGRQIFIKEGPGLEERSIDFLNSNLITFAEHFGLHIQILLLARVRRSRDDRFFTRYRV